MAFEFKNLDTDTRRMMVTEFQRDFHSGSWYKSNRLSDTGIREYPALLLNSFLNGTIESFENSIVPARHLKCAENYTKDFGAGARNMPSNAPKTLAGEFNRYYMIAICRRAIIENRKIRIYRGRASSTPRESSEKLIGKLISPNELLSTLKPIPSDRGLVWSPKQIIQPNSGLTLELI